MAFYCLWCVVSSRHKLTLIDVKWLKFSSGSFNVQLIRDYFLETFSFVIEYGLYCFVVASVAHVMETSATLIVCVELFVDKVRGGSKLS